MVILGPSANSLNRDIVFLIDGSDEARNKFSAVRKFIGSMVENFDIESGKDKVALVQYSNDAEISFNLSAYSARDGILNHIAGLKQKGGGPQYIGNALRFVKDNIFDSNAGGRRHTGAKQIIVMLASGRSRDSPRGPAVMLKVEGVTVFSLGSRKSSPAELRYISSEPTYAFTVPDFENLPRIQQRLLGFLNQIGEDEEINEGKEYFKLKKHNIQIRCSCSCMHTGHNSHIILQTTSKLVLKTEEKSSQDFL